MNIQHELRMFREYMHGDYPELPDLQLHKEVCPQCRGYGTSTAYLGDVTEWLREDPDAAEDYWGGMYDRTCETCSGRNVVDEVDEGRSHPETLKHWLQYVADAYDTEAIYEMERRMGA